MDYKGRRRVMNLLTAAPVNMVAIRISCPGQSTNETCLESGLISCEKIKVLTFATPSFRHRMVVHTGVKLLYSRGMIDSKLEGGMKGFGICKSTVSPCLAE